ncbi:phage tail sheath subtilisin-like domain-containing protein [Bradyrhizobium yuanmingense]|uniref:phage tail sheath family protein n=1 Tax=Bradyrhizobium yuanmingense TaxID=108015 RepID=UPI0023B9A136|nr:phage tail sheath C-terminal domain-containing protein [Bradyrhizobium yuanmingense]MDF0515728.1 phage tail sheath subtilisin-like domain-containing protein [Bradyrhizobium yuanmingense]
MPVALSYPGVYVEEVPSGVRTITGVATSVTAFVGRAIRGPVDKPITIFGFGDFQRQFGGLGVDHPMSYAVADFFRNGGGQAIIVRIFKPKKDANERDFKASVNVGGLALEPAHPGAWASGLEVTLERNLSEDAARRFGLEKDDLFNLKAELTVNGQVVAREQFLNLTLKDNPAARAQRVDRVLQQSSELLRVSASPSLPDTITMPTDRSAVSAKAEMPDDGVEDAIDDKVYIGDRNNKKGLYALENADLFNLLCIPPDQPGGDTAPAVYKEAMSYCTERRAMLIVDPPSDWGDNFAIDNPIDKLGKLGFSVNDTRNAALFFPRVKAPDPLSKGQQATFVPCGLVAGAMAATDARRGVWKAPAGLDAGLSGIDGLATKLTNGENGVLNQIGINCLRNFPIYGNVIWGARTLRGADQMADEYKYIPVRRLALFIEESLFRGTQWVVFEPNDEPLWAQIRLNLGAFMHDLFVQGAFQGSTPAAAYFVKCDKETTTQNDIDLGIVNIHVGFAPLKPAEFVVLRIQQIAGNIQT